MHEFVQFLDLIVSFQRFALLLFAFLLDFIHDLEAITPEIAARSRTVLLPGLQTNPAEVVFAFGAFHVIAAFVLLNRRFARGTRLGVGH